MTEEKKMIDCTNGKVAPVTEYGQEMMKRKDVLRCLVMIVYTDKTTISFDEDKRRTK